MRSYRLRYCIVFGCLLLALTGCNLQITPSAISAQLDAPFVLRLNQTATLSDVGMSITFAVVPADGRCPLNIECAATYPVRIGLRIEDMASGTMSDLELSAHTDYDGNVMPNAPGVTFVASYGDYQIHLERVTPYPDYEKERKLSEYAITLRVTQGIGVARAQ